MCAERPLSSEEEEEVRVRSDFLWGMAGCPTYD
jgi:hypothetical protein